MTGFLPAVLLFIGGSVAQVSGPPGDPSSDYVQYDLLSYRDRIEADGSSTRTMQTRVLLRTTTAVKEFGQIASSYVDGYGEVEFENVLIE
jgi:hypothetical protein